MPVPRNAPNDWPAAPWRPRAIGTRTDPRSTAPVNAAPKDRSAVEIRRPSRLIGPCPPSAATRRVSSGDDASRARSRPALAGLARRRASACQAGAPRTRPRPASPAASRIGRRIVPARPTISPTDRAPIAASSRRRSSASASAKRSTCSGVPVNLARRSARCVAIPVGQVSRWHWRAMSQPIATSAPVPERELLGPEQCRDEEVPTPLEPAVGPERHAVPEIVPEEHLVDLGQAELPWHADVLDRAERRRAGPAGAAGEMDVVGAGLGHAGRDRPDARAMRRA